MAFLSKQLPGDAPNGVSYQVHRIANALTQCGNTVTCFTFSNKPDDAIYNHIQLKYLFTNKVFRLFESGFQFARIKTDEFDIVHFHGDDYFCRGSGKRVRTFYGSALYEAYYAVTITRKIRQYLFYLLELLSCLKKGTNVGISETTKKALPSVRHIIGCSVPLDRFVESTEKTEYPSILFVGDLKSRKRGDLLLQQFSEVVIQKMPNAKVTIVGPEQCSGIGVIYKRNIEENELIKEYQKSWIYCCPSSYEGFGVPLCEAMACKTAVVACANPGIREIVTHAKNGLVCTPETLGTTLLLVLSESNLRNKLEENGLLHVKQFDSPIIAQRYLKLYNDIVFAGLKKI